MHIRAAALGIVKPTNHVMPIFSLLFGFQNIFISVEKLAGCTIKTNPNILSWTIAGLINGIENKL